MFVLCSLRAYKVGYFFHANTVKNFGVKIKNTPTRTVESGVLLVYLMQIRHFIDKKTHRVVVIDWETAANGMFTYFSISFVVKNMLKVRYSAKSLPRRAETQKKEAIDITLLKKERSKV